MFYIWPCITEVRISKLFSLSSLWLLQTLYPNRNNKPWHCCKQHYCRKFTKVNCYVALHSGSEWLFLWWESGLPLIKRCLVWSPAPQGFKVSLNKILKAKDLELRTVNATDGKRFQCHHSVNVCLSARWLVEESTLRGRDDQKKYYMNVVHLPFIMSKRWQQLQHSILRIVIFFYARERTWALFKSCKVGVMQCGTHYFFFESSERLLDNNCPVKTGTHSTSLSLYLSAKRR